MNEIMKSIVIKTSSIVLAAIILFLLLMLWENYRRKGGCGCGCGGAKPANDNHGTNTGVTGGMIPSGGIIGGGGVINMIG